MKPPTGLVLASVIAATQVAVAETSCPSPETMKPLAGEQTFTQTRTLSGLDRPLVSTGTVTISDDEVIWLVTDPVDIATRITESGIYQSVAGGDETPLHAGGGGNPFLTETGLLSIMRGDLEGAEDHYDRASSDMSESGWDLVFIPKSEALSSHLKTITLNGCTALELITIHQSNGDVVSVAFGDE
ncbi:MAG: hypothetical protein CMK07_07620 [Ponticaulis sp.]|nr:hypothetical protein [Ponticaulis sp.]